MKNKFLIVVVAIFLLVERSWIEPKLSAQAKIQFDDVTLRGIQFVDEKEGWAVGDQGYIEHTIDGGQTWEKQWSNTDASLRGLCFINPYTGWVVGRKEIPDGKSVGVVLATTDGGIHWKESNKNELPGLNVVKFFNASEGIIAGDGSEGFPTGIFVTYNSGKTWKMLPGERVGTWLDADFTSPEQGILAGTSSRLGLVRSGQFGAAEVDSLGGRNIRALKRSGDRAFAVGEGGMILISPDSGGVRWGFANLQLDEDFLASIDLNSMAMVGDKIWAVGRPGSFVLHSSDGGKTWRKQVIGQTLPLYALYFRDENNGFAVGAMGTVVSTQNGGKTWKVIQQQGQRAAVLFIHSNPQNMPLPVIAALTYDGAYRCVGLNMTSQPSSSFTEANHISASRFDASLQASGACLGETLWQFPLPRYQQSRSSTQLLQYWDTLHGDQAAKDWLRQLVLAIRIWRPEVIVTDPFPSKKGNEVVVLEGLLEAFKQAGDQSRFPEQITKLGLAPWEVKKVYALSTKEQPSNLVMQIDTWIDLLKTSANNYVHPARVLLNLADNPAASVSFRILAARSVDASGHQHLLQGSQLAEDGTARRKYIATGINVPSKNDLELFEKIRQFQSMLDQPGNAAIPKDQLETHLLQNLQNLPVEIRISIIHQIAFNLIQEGNWFTARELLKYLVDKYPLHPLSQQAARRLILYQTSSECRRMIQQMNYLVDTTTKVQGVSIPQKKNTAVQLASATQLVENSKKGEIDFQQDTVQWLKESLLLQNQLTKQGAIFNDDPSVQLAVLSAKRQLQDFAENSKWCLQYLNSHSTVGVGPPQLVGKDPWRDCVLTEAWLLNRSILSKSPKALNHCRFTKEAPILDASLDDSCWDNAMPMVMQTVSGKLDETYLHRTGLSTPFRSIYEENKIDKNAQKIAPSACWVTNDENFLYIAVQCLHPIRPALPKAKRKRDDNLADTDHIEIMLDLDRDYQSYFRLQVDERGRVAEDCWGDKKWNPKWFVAVKSTQSGWLAEIAIPRSELTPDSFRTGDVWAANIVRVIPGSGVMSWSTPAGVKPNPVGFGLWQFVDRTK